MTMNEILEIFYDDFLALRVKNLHVSGIRKIFNRAAAMTDCIDLSIGQTDFDVPPQIKESAQRAIRDGLNRYTETGGIVQLRDAIHRQIKERYGVSCEKVFVTAGVSGGLVLAFLTLVNPGDEVLISDPYFIVYKVLVEQFGGKPVFYDTYPDFKLRREEIESKITGKTKLIVINTPQNPTGACYSREELEMVADVAAKNNLLILSDEAYDRFDYEGEFVSTLTVYPNTIMLSGFSKSFGMPGWRIGYAAGPKPILDKMETLQQFTYVCAPAPFQKACAENLDIDLTTCIAAHRRKRDLVYNGLKDRYAFIKPLGALYAFIKVPWEGKTGTQFVEACLDRKLLLVPGGAFSQRDTHFRLCFGAPDEKLQAGIAILNDLADGRRIIKDQIYL